MIKYIKLQASTCDVLNKSVEALNCSYIVNFLMKTNQAPSLYYEFFSLILSIFFQLILCKLLLTYFWMAYA